MGLNDHMDDRGFDVVDTYVCTECIVDDVLTQLVNENLVSHSCSYCERSSESFVAAPFEIVMERIYESICAYYADAQDIGIPWDSGWVLPKTEPYDVLEAVNPGWEDKFTNDVLDCLGCDKYWVSHSQGDWGLSNPAQALAYGWSEFTDTVLYKTRYLFLSEPPDEFDVGRPDYIPVKYVLEALGNLVKRLNLVTVLDSGTVCYRVRVSTNGQVYSKFSEISIPPKGLAGAGRMNPAGIPYMYVALEKETAKLETLFKQKCPYAVAELKTIKPLKLLDLSVLPQSPSIFEPDKYTERHEIQFLRKFRDEISKPISKDGMEHIEYIPTQIISEYFRHRFTVDDSSIDGVVYKSSKNPNGKNVALFVSEHKGVEDMVLLSSLCMES
jgi:hypothetical protein